MKQTHCKRGHEIAIVGRDAQRCCNECRRDRCAAWRKANPEKMRKATRRYAGMVGVPDKEAQVGDPCDVCGKPMAVTPHADHDHSTGLFRGWVCKSCNVGLAFVERPGWIECAKSYLDRRTEPG